MSQINGHDLQTLFEKIKAENVSEKVNQRFDDPFFTNLEEKFTSSFFKENSYDLQTLFEKIKAEKISEKTNQGLDDPFFTNLDEKFTSSFFTKSGNDVSGDALVEKIEHLKSLEDKSDALRPEFSEPGEMIGNAYEHLQRMTPDDAAINFIYDAINKVVENETVGTIASFIQSLF